MNTLRKLWLTSLLLSVTIIAVAQNQSPATLPSNNSPAVNPPTVKVNPLTARPGDTIKLIVTTDKCPSQSVPQKWLDDKSLTISGSDLTANLLPDASDNCTNTYSVVVASRPMNRQLTILVSGRNPDPNSPDNDKRVSLGGPFTFLIADTPAIQPGPTPPGIASQVDVMWNVMSEVACRDQYGSRLAKYYFCIDVTLGNNSGYPLILAAVGFRRKIGDIDYREAAASYLSTRAMTQQGQLISARNITLRTLQASGALIAGFSPFSGNAGRRGRIAIWSTLFGSVLAAGWDAVVPDLTLKNVQNLDDAALRDGKLIPNNSPVRFSVFVDREAIKPLLLRSSADLLLDNQSLNSKAETLAQAASLENDLNKKIEFQAQSVRLRGMAKVTKDEAERRKNVGDKLTKPKKAFGPLGREKAILEDDLISVRFALGDLIIVGDQIEYLQRVKVDSAAVVPTIEPAPEVFSSTPAVRQGKADDIVLIGKGLAKAINIKALKCSPKFTTQPDSSGNSIVLKGFTVSNCAESAIPLMIDNGNASFLFNLPITSAPQINEPRKAELTRKENSITATFKELKGKGLKGAEVKIVALGDKKLESQISGKIGSISDTDLNFTADIPVDLIKTGNIKSSIQVATAAGGESTIEFTLAFKPNLNETQADVTAATNMKLVLKGIGLTGITRASVKIKVSGKDDLSVPASAIKIELVSDKEVTVTLSNIAAAYAVKDAKVALIVANGEEESKEITLTLK